MLTLTFERACFIMSVLGAVLIIESIPYLGFPGRVKQWALLLQEVPDGRLRALGLITFSAGLFFLLAAWIF